MALSEAEIMDVRTELQHNAGSFDRPQSYLAGIEDALAAVQQRLDSKPRDTHIVLDGQPTPEPKNSSVASGSSVG